MPIEDIQMTRRVMREIAKRNSVDGTMLQIRSIHGVVYLTGRVRSMRGAMNIDLKDEVGIIAQNIKRIAGIRDVIVEVQY